jgi:hypothetical protein
VDALRSGNKKVSIALKGNPAFRLTDNAYDEYGSASTFISQQ